ncbi:PIN domain-containing protein [Promineifilum sp.]|uniref:PIN domain-containing protein n=1 Tax=Promineifilum sp. TaxID=2664178 RepID=UPI0035B41E7D
MTSRPYLFDTGALIDIYRGRQRIAPYFEALAEQAAYLSVLSEAELWRSLRPGEIERHEALLARFVPLPLTSEAARLAGQWMQAYGAIGLGWMDALITATAAVAGSPLLTRDRRLAGVLANQVEFVLYDG